MVVAPASLWQYLNGYLQASAVVHMTQPSGIVTTLAVCIFLLGAYGNIYHDKVLARVRQGSGPKNKYQIPQGGMYSLVCFPNYLCEWVEWIGYAMLLRQPEGECP